MEDLGIVDQSDVSLWNGYLDTLKTSHVRLRNEVDVLVWNQSKSGRYTPKDGYLQMILDINDLEFSWWWKVLWKFKCPLQSKIFC